MSVFSYLMTRWPPQPRSSDSFLSFSVRFSKRSGWDLCATVNLDGGDSDACSALKITSSSLSRPEFCITCAQYLSGYRINLLFKANSLLGFWFSERSEVVACFIGRWIRALAGFCFGSTCNAVTCPVGSPLLTTDPVPLFTTSCIYIKKTKLKPYIVLCLSSNSKRLSNTVFFLVLHAFIS